MAARNIDEDLREQDGMPVRELLSESRRDQLSVYPEYWRPLRIGVLLSAAWKNRFGSFVLLLGRAGTPAHFPESEIDLLARCLPQIRLSEALMSGAEESGFECWSQRVGLSRREREVVALVARGLGNSEDGERAGGEEAPNGGA